MKQAEMRFDWKSAGLVLALHLLILLVLWLICLQMPERHEESGVAVVMGNMGNLDTDYDFTEVESYSAPAPEVPTSVAQAEPLVTQTLEETVSLDEGDRTVDKVVKPVEPTPEQLREQAEQQAAAEANSLMQNLFGQSNVTASASSDNVSPNEGVTGSPTGNSTQGKVTGVGGYGTFDLNGRDVDANGLQRPVYDVQEEGRVVVTITVNPVGTVIATSINKRSNTMNAQLRKAAEDAARRTRFNAVDGPDNQTGTITYYFRLK